MVRPGVARRTIVRPLSARAQAASDFMEPTAGPRASFIGNILPMSEVVDRHTGDGGALGVGGELDVVGRPETTVGHLHDPRLRVGRGGARPTFNSYQPNDGTHGEPERLGGLEVGHIVVNGLTEQVPDVL